MTGRSSDLSRLQQRVWDSKIPLEIRLANGDSRVYDQTDAYLVQCPRLSYLPFLLQRLHVFFSPVLIDPDVSPYDGWFSYEQVPLKWHYPVGLLHDLYAGAESTHGNGPYNDRNRAADENFDDQEGNGSTWKLTVHFTNWPEEQLIRLDSKGKILQDSFINSVKEADFLRNGSAKTVMSLSKDDSTQLWESVQTDTLQLFNAVNNKLLNPPGLPCRHIPIKIYLPASAAASQGSETVKPGHLRVVQAPITPNLSSRQPQTLGTALNSLLPSLFPSRRNPLLAQPVLHGAVLPLSAKVEDLMRFATYADGWLHLAVVMLG